MFTICFKLLKKKIAPILLILFHLQNPLFAQNNNAVKSKNDTTEKIGDVALVVLPIATLATTFLTDDKKGVWQFTKGLLLTEAITYGLKWSINKPRPDLSNNNSFPSGHTSTTFHSAAFIHKRYGFKYSLPAYLLAGFTAASRIDSQKHDILDVLAGAAIGIGSNLLFTSEYQKKHLELSYSNNQGNHMIGFNYKF
ncbi:phosphatase PAP2 family protein [Winogradskyella flava]|uniref:phosphatase PAP2 family protein n=1 Tax=Winogradskyella flava TaxID=1884876 RepID=UPI00249222B8|nr:phosphatase PAP2 family protein [Winogradskyella flava]